MSLVTIRNKWNLEGGALIAFLWLLICGGSLLQLWPWRPTSPLQWVVFVLSAPLVYALLESAGNFMLSPQISARISKHQFSWLRVGYAIVAILLALAAFYAAIVLVATFFLSNDT